ncbi:MAG: hypothetical protein JKY71_06935 [Alphaproteobacteria bacterium]|nr:hypothetical protein [Alphaproteobacteria bacterium]
MTSRRKNDNPGEKPVNTVPFRDAEEAWFWFVAAQAAKNDGARFSAGTALYPRPCEPLDILKVLDRLYRTRRLVRDHLLVLRHYGRRHLPPDPHRKKEIRAYQLWHEALERIGVVLARKGIIEKPRAVHENWAHEAILYENANMNLQFEEGIAAE